MTYSHQWHEGELEVQRRAGSVQSAYQMRDMVQSQMDPQSHGYFLSIVPFVVLSSVDKGGYPWASLAITGQGEFAWVIDHYSYVIARKAVAKNDILWENISEDGHPLGGLWINPAGRNRVSAAAVDRHSLSLSADEQFLYNPLQVRVNGQVRSTHQTGRQKIRVFVKEVFGNCPKYIQKRDVEYLDISVLETLQRQESNRDAFALTVSQRNLIRQCNTFFVASVFSTTEGSLFADTSHRGGNPGFVRVSSNGTSIQWPEYSGNGLYNTLGNIQSSGKAGMLFVDFENGRMLQISGKARIVWKQTMDNSDKFVEVEIVHIYDYVPSANRPLMRMPELENGQSPFNPKLLGEGAPTKQPPEGRVLVRLENIQSLAPHVKAFTFRVLPPSRDTNTRGTKTAKKEEQLIRLLHAYQPGSYVTMDLSETLPHSFANGVDCTSLYRSWTLSSAPGILRLRTANEESEVSFTLTIKRETEGLVSRWLHDHAEAGTTVVDVIGVGGDGSMSTFMKWDTLELQRELLCTTMNNPAYSTILLVSGGIGITPILANLRSWRHLHWMAPHQQLPRFTMLHATSQAELLWMEEEVEGMLEEGVLDQAVFAVSKGLPQEQKNPNFQYTSGRVNKQLLSLLLPPSKVFSVFLCGPLDMRNTVHRDLLDLGVPSAFIHEESFAYWHD